MAETVDKQILMVDQGGAVYRFRHALLREAVYAALLPGERRRLHRRLATVLAAEPALGAPVPGHGVAEQAAHWWAAGEWAQALSASRAAADTDLAAWAFPEALAHLERALSAFDRLPPADGPGEVVHLGLLEMASDAAYLAGDGQRSIELAHTAIGVAAAIADPWAAARCHTLVGRSTWGIGDSDAAFEAYERAAALLPADPPSPELVRVLAEQARGLMLMARFSDAEARCREAIAAAQAVGSRSEEGHVLNTLGCCRSSLGHTDEGIALLREALAIAKELPGADDLDRAYTNLSHLLLDSGRLEEAAALVFESLEHLGFLRLNGAAANSAYALIRMGRYHEAEGLLARMGDKGIGICATAPQLVPVAMAIRQGRLEEAGRLLAGADELTARLRDVQTRGVFHIRSAELALEEGRSEVAYEQIELALGLAAGTDDESFRPEMCWLGVRSLADRFEQGRARGQRAESGKVRLLAVGLVEEAERLVAAPVERGGRSSPAAAAFASSCAAEQSRLHQSDPDRWRRAASLWEAAGEPYPVAYCNWRQAEALLESRAGRNRAGDCLQAAWRITVDLGACPLGERIAQLARRARIPLGEAEDREPAGSSTLTADFGLTPREVEVLGRLAAGRTDREIAEELFISKKTASVHVSNLLRKLEVTNRVEAGKVGQAHRLG